MTEEVTQQTRRRKRLLRLDYFAHVLEFPMVLLAIGWIVLLVIELVHGLNPFLTGVGTAIWVIFVLDFLLRISIAPDKIAFLKRNWLTLASLLVPALRAFRIARLVMLLRASRTVRGLRLLKVVSSANRGLRAAAMSTSRQGAPYVLVATLMVVFIGAAGMYAFEARNVVTDGFSNYTEALWWTAMLVTSIGSQYWPQTLEGRVLTLLLSLYGLGVLGYITAFLASVLVGRSDRQNEDSANLRQIQADLAEIKAALKDGPDPTTSSDDREKPDHGDD